MELEITDGKDKRFVALCEKLDEFLNDAVGGEKQRSEYVQFNKLDDIHNVVLVVEAGQAVGCGAFKEYSEKVAEVKRVFVSPTCRGKRYGSAIIKRLESLAAEQGYKKLILETGKPLVGAMKMYQGLGFYITPNYGQYKNMTSSVCMEKLL